MTTSPITMMAATMMTTMMMAVTRGGSLVRPHNSGSYGRANNKNNERPSRRYFDGATRSHLAC